MIRLHRVDARRSRLVLMLNQESRAIDRGTGDGRNPGGTGLDSDSGTTAAGGPGDRRRLLRPSAARLFRRQVRRRPHSESFLPRLGTEIAGRTSRGARTRHSRRRRTGSRRPAESCGGLAGLTRIEQPPADQAAGGRFARPTAPDHASRPSSASATDSRRRRLRRTAGEFSGRRGPGIRGRAGRVAESSRLDVLGDELGETLRHRSALVPAALREFDEVGEGIFLVDADDPLRRVVQPA